MTEGENASMDAMWDAYNRFHYLCDTARFQKLAARMELVRMVRDVPGDVVDAGCYKGASTIQFAHLLQIYRPHSPARVVAFDTFADAFPRAAPEEKAAAAAHMATYDRDAYEKLIEAVERLGLSRRVEIVRGDIVETLPAYVARHPGFRIALLHCDLDVHPATLATLEAAWPRVVSGGLVVFDEYAVREWGESDAADAFFARLGVRPRLRALDCAGTPTAYCVKD